jgi:hypothetical protein
VEFGVEGRRFEAKKRDDGVRKFTSNLEPQASNPEACFGVIPSIIVDGR